MQANPDPNTNSSEGMSTLAYMSRLEHVRTRPCLFFGDTGRRGLHHMVDEVVDNAIAEVMAGFATEISVTINHGGSVTVKDNGRGIPVDDLPFWNMSNLEWKMTERCCRFGAPQGLVCDPPPPYLLNPDVSQTNTPNHP